MSAPSVGAVLFDRDGTLVVDVPHNGVPEQVRPVPQAAAALARLRRLGIPTAVVTNQPGIAAGRLQRCQVDAVHERLDQLIGPVGPYFVCEHAASDGCGCRKPAPGLVLWAARVLQVRPEDCAVIGDIGSDLAAATAAGARGVLVPTAVTRTEEVAAAARVAPDLLGALDLLGVGA